MIHATPLGDRALRFARPRETSPRAIVDALHTLPGVIDVVVTRDDIAIYFDAPAIDLAALTTLLDSLSRLPPPVGRMIELRASYDGPDLEEVARVAGMTTTEVAALHAAATYDVDTMGFAPGFAYLVGLDPALRVPRRATPRTRVPAGALALAAEFTAVYPFDSPGGWNLIGHVEQKLFTEAGALLQLGDRVRFVR